MSDTSIKGRRTISLSKRELTYLANTKFLPEDLGLIINKMATSPDEKRILQLDRNTAERFREELTNRLARVGFGRDYEPTSEGILLEDLIDKFSGK